MARLRGTGLGAGMALGTTAVVRSRGGVALMPEVPARIADLIAARRLEETPEVILVADEYRTVRTVAESLPWAKVVGAVVAYAESDAPSPPFPVVANVPNLLETVADDVLTLVDATRGTVLIDPDPVALAQYQAEDANIAPKQRLFLEDVHLPAQTLDGRDIAGILVADPDSSDRTTGRLPQLAELPRRRQATQHRQAMEQRSAKHFRRDEPGGETSERRK